MGGGKFPYDSESRIEGMETTILKECFNLSSELMHLYEPFGQAASSYESGAPEYVALGIRTFLSIPSNIQMMETIGKQTLESITTLAQVEEFRLARIKKDGKSPNEGDHFSEEWLAIKEELKQTDKRTYDIVMKATKEHVDKCMAKHQLEDDRKSDTESPNKSVYILTCEEDKSNGEHSSSRSLFCLIATPFNHLKNAKDYAEAYHTRNYKGLTLRTTWQRQDNKTWVAGGTGMIYTITETEVK